MEGISTEAAELAGVWKLGKLIYILMTTIFLLTEMLQSIITNQKKKFESMGWHVLEIDGHNENEIIEAVESQKKKPISLH